MRLPHKVCCQSDTARIRIVSSNVSGAKGSVVAHAARQSTVTCSGPCKSVSNDSKGDIDGAATGVQTHATHSQQRASRRQARALLANRLQSVSTSAIMRTSSAGTATSTSSSTSNNGASSGGGVLLATMETNSPAPVPGINRGHTHHRALVLDSGFRPINVVTWVRAVMLDVNAKADVLEYYQPPAFAYSGRGEHPLPAVVRVHTSVNLSELVARVSCTRRNIMIRDKFQCQYCGARRELTLDHVVPASRGGKDTWTNLVTACGSCNQKKADKPLSSLQGWHLRTQPREPRPWEIGVVVGLTSSELDHAPEEWEPYIEQYRARQRQIRRDLRAAGIYTFDDDDDDEDTSGWS